MTVVKVKQRSKITSNLVPGIPKVINKCTFLVHRKRELFTEKKRQKVEESTSSERNFLNLQFFIDS